MLDKKFIEKLLVANGVEPTASDEDIKSVLILAKWHNDDVDTALSVLRENKETHQTTVSSTQNIFYSDNRLQPETISALLGIDVDIPAADLHKGIQQRMNIMATVYVALISTAIALLAVLGVMWRLKMGFFFEG